MKTVCIITLGCKINQYESAQFAAKYAAEGWKVVQKFTPNADLYIVNTCAVTGFAEKKSRYEVSRIKRNNPHATTMVCGCTTDRALNKSVENKCASQPRRRAFVKVQDGCNNFCSYCIVPHIRGRSTSRPISEIINELKGSECADKSIVLTGIDLSDFKPGLGELCTEVNKLARPFELSSLEVRIITEDFLKTLKNCENFIPKFHLPLQSGSDAVLYAMNRPYKTFEYAEAISKIQGAFQSAVISTDIIVGFPSETDKDFQQTLDFAKKINFNSIHVFPYSVRNGTPAGEMKQLPSHVITERAAALRRIC